MINNTIPVFVAPDHQIPAGRITGEAQKRILVITMSEEIPEHLIFLKKILASVQIELEKDAGFLLVQSDDEFRLLASDVIQGYDYIINFGAPLKNIGISSASGSPISHFEKLIVLSSHNLSQLQENREFKGKLWIALKAVFADNKIQA